MVDISITLDDRKVRRDLNGLADSILPLALRPVHIAAQWVAGRVQKDYLRGPRPEHLEVDTGRLRGSIHSMTVLTKNGIEGHVGTNVRGLRGFNYPKYWELDGSAHGGPRPFLAPARDENWFKIAAIFKKEFKARLEKWLSARGSSTT